MKTCSYQLPSALLPQLHTAASRCYSQLFCLPAQADPLRLI
jgi:hypothetical protein